VDGSISSVQGIIGGTGFLKRDEAFLHQWLIDPPISHGIIGETSLLEDCFALFKIFFKNPVLLVK
jgi:hypothetical protein